MPITPTKVHFEAAGRNSSGVGEGDSGNDSQRIHCLAESGRPSQIFHEEFQ